jgi:hypothetical protein
MGGIGPELIARYLVWWIATPEMGLLLVQQCSCWSTQLLFILGRGFRRNISSCARMGHQSEMQERVENGSPSAPALNTSECPNKWYRLDNQETS